VEISHTLFCCLSSIETPSQGKITMQTITMKFGGTSVGSPEAIAQVVDIVGGEVQEGNRVVVVVSAMSGVTDQLLEAVSAAASGNKWGYLSIAQKLRDRHEEAINLLTSPGQVRESTLSKVNALVDELVQLCQAVTVLHESTPRIHDAVVSFGERLSCRVVAAALREQGVNAAPYDASQFLLTDENYQAANPLWDETQSRVEKKLLPALNDGITPVITGFIGATAKGDFTTLGRGGSDYSGALFAALTHSHELIIWTDVDGVMTTDPRIDKRARVLPYVSYQEVGELAYFGAKVLHPKTVQPIVDRGMPLRVRNTFNPDHPGTLIGATSEPSSTIIKAVTSVRNVSLLTVSGRGMIGVPGIAGRTFLTTARTGTSLLMFSQASSEQSFCFVIPSDKAYIVKEAIEQEFAGEIAVQNIDHVDVLENVAIVTTVGSGMRGTPGVAGRVFSVMGNNNINVIAIAQGSSECSISFVVDGAELKQAVVALHDLALEAVQV
jgi:bifunctional aspartokinase / homoserine dehydrogenase 1